MWLENRRKGLRGGIGTDGRRKAVKEIGREKRKNLMKQSKNRDWKEKDKKRRSPPYPTPPHKLNKRMPILFQMSVMFLSNMFFAQFKGNSSN